MITLVKGNLFDTHDTILCHCISADYKMGAGIAVQFKYRFGRPKDKVNVGESVTTTGVYEQRDIGFSRKIAYNLVTKENYFDKPKPEALQKSLEHMRDHILSSIATKNKSNVDNGSADDYDGDDDGKINISMPKIGSGLDKLDWDNQVLPIIKTVFADTKDIINIKVYHL